MKTPEKSAKVEPKTDPVMVDEMKSLGMKDVHKPMGGSIHVIKRNVRFNDPSGKNVKHDVVLDFSRSDHYGKQAVFATVYRHQCGEVAISTSPGHCVRMSTLLDSVLPVMEKFDEMAKTVPDDGTAHILCLDGGCDICRTPLGFAFSFFNDLTDEQKQKIKDEIASVVSKQAVSDMDGEVKEAAQK